MGKVFARSSARLDPARAAADGNGPPNLQRDSSLWEQITGGARPTMRHSLKLPKLPRFLPKTLNHYWKNVEEPGILGDLTGGYWQVTLNQENLDGCFPVPRVLTNVPPTRTAWKLCVWRERGWRPRRPESIESPFFAARPHVGQPTNGGPGGLRLAFYGSTPDARYTLPGPPLSLGARHGGSTKGSRT